MQEGKQIVLKDSDHVRNVIIQSDLSNNTTSVFSGFSAWENLALIMESLEVTAQKCIEEGIPKKKVYDEIKNYILKLNQGYKIIKRV